MMPMIDVRDTSLYYELAGEGDTALLFIHGMCGGAWNWEDQMNRLSGEFTCVAYDRRGHARSAPGTEDQSNRTHADDAAALIEALGLDRPIVVGASAGGAITAELLLRYPDLVRGAVLMEPALLGLDPAAAQALINELGPLIENARADGGPRAAVDAFFQVVCSSFWAQIDEGQRNRVRDNAPLLFATLEAQGATLTTDDVASIELPVLVIEGTNSPQIHRSIDRILVRHLPNVRVVEVEGSEHVVYAEKPDEFAQAVQAFAREITDPVGASSRS